MPWKHSSCQHISVVGVEAFYDLCLDSRVARAVRMRGHKTKQPDTTGQVEFAQLECVKLMQACFCILRAKMDTKMVELHVESPLGLSARSQPQLTPNECSDGPVRVYQKMIQLNAPTRHKDTNSLQ